jgi:hypothetical protein
MYFKTISSSICVHVTNQHASERNCVCERHVADEVFDFEWFVACVCCSRVTTMMVGAVLNVFCIFFVSAIMLTYAPLVFDFDIGEVCDNKLERCCASDVRFLGTRMG